VRRSPARRPARRCANVCKFGAEERPAAVLIFTQKADDNLVTVVKAVDAVQKNNEKLGTVVIGVSGVQAADLKRSRPPTS